MHPSCREYMSLIFIEIVLSCPVPQSYREKDDNIMPCRHDVMWCDRRHGAAADGVNRFRDCKSLNEPRSF